MYKRKQKKQYLELWIGYCRDYDTNLFIKLDPSEVVLAKEFNQEPTNQEPTVNQPMNEVHHEPM